MPTSLPGWTRPADMLKVGLALPGIDLTFDAASEER
jgi:hypothetical protein